MAAADIEQKLKLETRKIRNIAVFLRVKGFIRALKKALDKKYQQIRSIKWVHGSNGERTLPLLPYTDFTLMPTGDLLDRRIMPLSGERGNGITEGGINQKDISGVLPENFQYSWNYAQYHRDMIDWKQLEDDSFYYAHRDIDFIFTTFKEEHAVYGVEQAAQRILMCRQLNEKRYQEEFVNTHKIERLRLLASDDKNYSIFKEQQQIIEAFSTKIPEEAMLSNDKEGLKIVEFIDKFIAGKGLKNLFIKREMKIYLACYMSQFKNLEVEFEILRGFGEKTLVSQILFLKSFDEHYVSEIKKGVLDFIASRIELIKKSQRRLSLFMSEKPLYHYDEKIRKEIHELGNLPLIFSTTKGYKKGAFSKKIETTHSGVMKLGEDIDVIITDNDENLRKLKRYLSSKGIGMSKVQVCTEGQFRKVWR